MLSTKRVAAAFLAAFTTLSSATSIPISHPTEFGPSKAAARQNAFDIFNAIHSAMRQWGSSLNHNGMSLFLATIPAGVLLHHGTHSPTPPQGPEWLAFEIEHAELFAHPSMRGPPMKPTPPLPSPQQQQQQQQQQQHPLLQHNPHPTNDTPPPEHGYLHTYLTTAPLPLLYLDGTSAGNTLMGTLDTQDLLLRLNRSASLWDEPGRARELCDLVTSWGLHGVIRMEAGFEVIKCDFSMGMELLSAGRRPEVGEPGGDAGRRVVMFEYVRAVGRRYGGIGGNRVGVDWGSMVSAWFYYGGVDLRDGEGRPRLVGVGDEELRGIRGRVEEVVRGRRGGGERVIDWQGVVDSVVERYADRLKYMAEGVESVEMMRGEVNGLLNTYIDYGVKDEGYQAAMGRCARFHAHGVIQETQEDELILTAIEAVTLRICSTLFGVRKLVVEDPQADDASVNAAKQSLRGLMDKLRWTRWKECAACSFDELCFWRSKSERQQKQCVSRESNAGPIDGNDGFYH
ncbi:hypothetical protein C8A01DRAFT_45933 [Parachaetomium inaequale]|uniref:Uncharacterized protein n=1 Tax=Parachaetomium inaequale TaxID=2588326 RepID=A0AAN6PH00_9PEZI|nr:hypothetical protein C8A01DRAFT_45933 [Parachaetomium inaequale]